MNIANVLTEKYLIKAVRSGKRSRDIARETGINDRTIRWYFRKYNLKVPKWKTHTVWNKGLKAKDDKRVARFANAGHEARRGKPAWNKGKKLPPLSEECKEKISKALKGKYTGKLNSNWKNGATEKNKLLRMSFAFKEWRKKVFERDCYTCQMCGQVSGELHPHHIKKFADYPKLRFVVDNGVTLCKFCHINYTDWGHRK